VRKARTRLPRVKPAIVPSIKGFRATSETTVAKEEPLRHQASTEIIKTTRGPINKRIGVRSLMLSFLLSGESEKYCTAKDTATNPMKTENTKGLFRTVSLTALGIGISKLFWCQEYTTADTGTATATIKRVFHNQDNNFSLIKAVFTMNHQP
jgi:hypothetical protein